MTDYSYFSFLKEAIDSGNPSAAGMSPAERAQQLGLQSDGSGGYIDPETGQVVARTVNGELVFYDNRGASGGVVTDGEGGQKLANAQPSWSDPKTGMLTTPPAQPESEEELAAVPDATPAVPPMGYTEFMKKKKEQAYAYTEPEPQENTGDMGGIPAMAGMIGGDMSVGDAGGAMGEDYTPDDLQKRVTPEPKPTFQQKVDTMKKMARSNDEQPQQPQVQQPQTNLPQQEPDKDEGRRQKLTGALEHLIANPKKRRGAGVNDLSEDDLTKFVDYINNGSKVQKTPVSDEEMEFANKYIKEKLGKSWGGLQNRLKGKGDPSPDRKVVSRAQEVLRSYLENLGQSSIDGSPLNFSESELDHITSLDNGGLDQGDNWAWLPKRFNQFKGALTDGEVLEKIRKQRAVNPADKELKQMEKDHINKMRGDWKENFKQKGWDDLNQADIMQATGAQGLQFLKALAEASGTSYYKDRGVTRASGRAGGGTQLNVGELQQKLIDNLMIPAKGDIDAWDETLVQTLQELEDGRSNLASAKKKRQAEKRAEKKKM